MREIKFVYWNGDDSISHKDGEYTYVKAEWHPFANRRGYVKKHRLVLEKKLGYFLPKGTVVHHINGDKRDDSETNLQVIADQKIHAQNHDTSKRNTNGEFVANDPKFQEIKFRLYNKHTQQYEVYTLAKLIRTTFRNSQFSFAGRFTGLKDKTGKEIYEKDYLGDWCVYWGSGKYILQNISTGDIIDCNEQNTQTKEITGNFYESPREHTTMASDL